MAVTKTTIRPDADLVDEAMKVLGTKSRTDTVDIALREIVALRRFKTLMKKNAGKLTFAGFEEESYERAEREAKTLLDQGFHLGGVIRAGRDEWHER